MELMDSILVGTIIITSCSRFFHHTGPPNHLRFFRGKRRYGCTGSGDGTVSDERTIVERDCVDADEICV